MKNLLNKNGLVIWSEKEIDYRNFFIERISKRIKERLLEENKAWKFERIESSCIIPLELVNPEYDRDDFFSFNDDLALRPETTAVSYKQIESLMDQGVMPPIVVWQSGKSFRNESDNVEKNMRLKEFYQLEFQCAFSEGTLNDYHTILVQEAEHAVNELISLPTRIVESDRLPSYSMKTYDIEVQTPEKWLEVCSVSFRTDFSKEFKGKKMYIVEVAFGLDRLVYLIP